MSKHHEFLIKFVTMNSGIVCEEYRVDDKKYF